MNVAALNESAHKPAPGADLHSGELHQSVEANKLDSSLTTNLLLTGGYLKFVDANTTNSRQRFYRLVPGP